jgi:hypothetical protein
LAWKETLHVEEIWKCTNSHIVFTERIPKKIFLWEAHPAANDRIHKNLWQCGHLNSTSALGKPGTRWSFLSISSVMDGTLLRMLSWMPLGELSEDAVKKYHVHGAAVAGAPFDHECNYPFVNAPGYPTCNIQWDLSISR